MAQYQQWIIRNVNDVELVWSNADGWVEGCCNDYDTFSGEEKVSMDLPMDGEWVGIPSPAELPA